MNYGKGILAARTRAGVSKRQLALKAKLHPSYITHIECERKRPSLDALEAIAGALGIPVPLLLLMSAEDEELVGVDASTAAVLGERLHALALELEDAE